MKKIFLAMLLACLSASSLSAQSTTGSLVGTISSSDGVIPGATIVVTDNQTKKERTFTSGDNGTFAAPQLEFGTYTVKITATGFKTFTATDLKIDAGRDYSLNPTLEVGGVTESVTVVAGADVVNAANGELSGTVSPAQITQLPLDGRSPLSLITLQAGAASSGANGGTTSINGQRTAFTNITRDGINVNDNFIRANGTDFSPERSTSDDTGEFTIVTQNAGADQGYGAAQVRLVTPRGQSEFHGALYEYNRNSKFTANTYPNNASDQPRAFLNRNQFGGKIGGPLPVPRFGEGGASLTKGRGFFFFAYEKQYLRQSQTNTSSVLTPEAKSGVFRFVDSAGVTRNVNIFSLLPAGTPGNPPTAIDPIIQSRILAGMPSPNTPGGDLNTGFFSVNQGFNDDYDYYTTRIDVDINDRHTINGVYTYKDEIVQRPDVTLDNFTNSAAVLQPGINKFLALAYNATPTPSFNNEVRGGFSFPKAVFNRLNPVPDFFIRTPTINNVPRANGGLDYVNSPETVFLNQGRYQENYNIQDNATYARGNHSFRFGVLGQFFRVNPFNEAGRVATYVLGVGNNTPQLTPANFASVLPSGATISNADVASANSLLALLGGIINGGTQTFNPTSRSGGFAPTTTFQDFAYDNYAAYVSDQWRLFPSLTLNVGLRYELSTGLKIKNGLALEPLIPSGTDARTAILDPNGGYGFIGTNSGVDTQLYKTDKNNFAPVVSFAYSPQFKNALLGSIFGEGRTVIRGGFRVSYVQDQVLTSTRNAIIQNIGLGSTALNAVVNGSALLNARPDSVPGITPPGGFSLPVTFAQNNSAAFANFGTVYGVDPELQSPSTKEYSFGVQRELGFQTAVEVRYVGSYSRNLIRAADFNQVQIIGNGFLEDYLRAQSNRTNTGNAFCNAATTANCQALTIFGTGPTARIRVATAANALPLTTFNARLADGTPGQLAFQILQANADFNTANGQFPLTPNPNAGVANLVFNGAKYYYNSLQAEVRRRFAQGFYFQANYTFQKNLTDSVGTSQALLDPYLDINQPELEYSRADFDQTHNFNFNTIFELPFGQGRRFLNEGGWVDKVFGGFQLTTILRFGSGSPLTILDPGRGTLNRGGRSGRNTASSTLSKDEIKNLFGDFTQDGVRYFINPSALDITTNANGTTTSRPKSTIFFGAGPGEVGNLERGIVNGPNQFNMDAGLAKRIRFTESTSLQLRAEAFNLTNRNNFFIGPAGATFQNINIQSSSFGQLSPNFSSQAQGLEEPRRLQFALRFEF